MMTQKGSGDGGGHTSALGNLWHGPALQACCQLTSSVTSAAQELTHQDSSIRRCICVSFAKPCVCLLCPNTKGEGLAL